MLGVSRQRSLLNGSLSRSHKGKHAPRIHCHPGLLLLAVAHTGCMSAVAAIQPEKIRGETIGLTTTDADGESRERVVSPIDYDGRGARPETRFRRAAGAPQLRGRGWRRRGAHASRLEQALWASLCPAGSSLIAGPSLPAPGSSEIGRRWSRIRSPRSPAHLWAISTYPPGDE